jgi:hypothetical protein
MPQQTSTQQAPGQQQQPQNAESDINSAFSSQITK